MLITLNGVTNTSVYPTRHCRVAHIPCKQKCDGSLISSNSMAYWNPLSDSDLGNILIEHHTVQIWKHLNIKIKKVAYHIIRYYACPPSNLLSKQVAPFRKSSHL